MAIPSFTLLQLTAGAPGTDTALTVGVLDGVHLGHQALLARLREEARTRRLKPGVVTLHPHPLTVLRPEIRPSYLTTLEDRMELLRAAGADWVIPLTFTSEVSEVTAEELATAFYERLRMRLLVLGPDASFGRGAPKDVFERMTALGATRGFEVVQIEALMLGAERCSSTAVRAALAEGNMDRVTSLLGRPYRLAGPIVHGFERGRTIGFPTANISVALDRAMPALGVYATRAIVNGVTWPGATNIGTRPTFDAGHVSVETNMIGFEGDIYDERMELDFVHRIRGEQAFPSVDELVAQIGRDVDTARTMLEADAKADAGRSR
jgi:riboflavin kinase/FMN adenylyltransferase